MYKLLTLISCLLLFGFSNAAYLSIGTYSVNCGALDRTYVYEIDVCKGTDNVTHPFFAYMISDNHAMQFTCTDQTCTTCVLNNTNPLDQCTTSNTKYTVSNTFPSALNKIVGTEYMTTNCTNVYYWTIFGPSVTCSSLPLDKCIGQGNEIRSMWFHCGGRRTETSNFTFISPSPSPSVSPSPSRSPLPSGSPSRSPSPSPSPSPSSGIPLPAATSTASYLLFSLGFIFVVTALILM